MLLLWPRLLSWLYLKLGRRSRRRRRMGETPYIEPPGERRDNPDDGLMCFINPDRQCGADCMAYTTSGSESPYLNEQQGHCAVIVGIERLGRYTGGLLSVMKKESADAKRGVPSPQSPKGAG